MPIDKEFLDEVALEVIYITMTGFGQVRATYDGEIIGRAPFRVDGLEQDEVQLGFGTQAISVNEAYQKRGLAEAMCKEAIGYTKNHMDPKRYILNTQDKGMAKVAERLGFLGDTDFAEKSGFYCFLKNNYNHSTSRK